MRSCAGRSLLILRSIARRVVLKLGSVIYPRDRAAPTPAIFVYAQGRYPKDNSLVWGFLKIVY